jgi:hypothetical protein
MILTDDHLEKIREAAKQVEYGSVTINISAASTKLDLSINSRLRFDDEAEGTNGRRPMRSGTSAIKPKR